ncbi:hypothetical protein [Streptomyces flaveolus]|uniref:hypothetical protein n=1 Tax=Streptomyces flaveolus TaxID=67297 RepID=UPI0033E0099B
MSGQEPREAGRDDFTPERETLIATERALARALTPHVDVESAFAALMRRTAAEPTDTATQESPQPNPPTHEAVMQELREDLMRELRELRRAGLDRTRQYPALSDAAQASGFSTELGRPQGIETLLREAVRRLGQDTSLGQAAAHSFGLLPGRRSDPSIDRRRNAAKVYGISTERFRKSEEVLILDKVADAILAILRQRQRMPGTTPSQQRDQRQLPMGELGPWRSGRGGRP